MKSLYDSALSGITSILSDKISDLNDARDEEIEKLEEVRDKAVSAIQEQIDAKQKEIDKIKEISKQRQNEIDLQKKQYNLERLQNQNTRRIFKDGQVIFEQDYEGIRDAREELTQVEEEIEISRIESEIDSLEIQLKGVEKYYDSLIEKKNAYYNQEIKFLEQQKEMWEDFSNTLEMAEIIEPLKALGLSMEDILSGNTAVLNNFKDNYLAICAAINSGNEDYLNGLSQSSGKSVAELQAMAEQFKATGNLVSELSNTASTASTPIKDTASAVGEMNTNSEGLDTKLGNISSALNSIPASEKIGGLSSEFINLAEAIGKVATALGISTEDSVGGLLEALTSLSTFSFDNGENGIIAQFNALKTAVDGVTSAISGGGSKANEGGGIATGANGGSATLNMSGESSDGLISSIDKLQQTAEESLGVASTEKEEGSGIIGKFSALKTAIDDVTKTIGTDDGNDKEESDTLISALRKHYETAEETLPEVKNFFEELLGSITACVDKLGELSNGIISLDSGGNGGEPVKFAAKGTPHAKKGLYVVAEEAPELIEDTKGNLSLATQLNMKGGEKVYNGEETDELLAGSKRIRKAWDEYTTKYANNPELYATDMMKTSPYLFTTSQDIWNRQLDYMTGKDKVAPRVENKSNSYNVGDVHIHCSGITSKDVAEQTVRELDKQLFGMQGYFRQQASITR